MAIIGEKMKRFIYILTAVAAMISAAAGCQKVENETVKTETVTSIDSHLVGEWKLNEIISEGYNNHDVPEIYLCINADCTFELYQKSGTQSIRFDKFTGTCYTEDGLLTGVYSSGKEWASKWEYFPTVAGITLKSFNLLEENRYVKTESPSEVKENANLVDTKSAYAVSTPIL